MVSDGLAYGGEDYAGLLQGSLVGGGNGNAVQHRVHGDAGQLFLLLKRYTQLVEGRQHLRVDLFQTPGPIFLGGGRGVIDNVLIVDGRVVNVSPLGLFEVQFDPVAVGLEAPLQHPIRFALFGGDEPDDIFVQPFRGHVRLDVDSEPPLVVGVEIVRACSGPRYDPRSGHQPLLNYLWRATPLFFNDINPGLPP